MSAALGARADGEDGVLHRAALVGDLGDGRQVPGRHRDLGDGVDVLVAEFAARGDDLSTRRGDHPARHPRLAGHLGDDLVERLALGDLGQELALADQGGGEPGDAVLGMGTGDVLGHVDEGDVGRDGEQRQAVRAAGLDDVVGHVAEQTLAGDQRGDVGFAESLTKASLSLASRRHIKPVITTSPGLR